ncbi:MAG: tRNA preQ1(34) S-adenosylmethionine ribosyltransferase-isomerase QueA [Paracoccaceae bacterium]|nr:tRNA preQ1(34) S-adenosylmethionine ribosyltransferase-isomerase QueA [Paracoccaceae bacterium]
MATILSEFDFNLPDERIALRPAQPRSASRLLVASGTLITDATFADLPKFLRPGDRLVMNDTRVIPARLHGVRKRMSQAGSGLEPAGIQIEVLLTRQHSDGSWSALARPGRRIRQGDRLIFGNGLTAKVLEKDRKELRLAFNRTGSDFHDVLGRVGETPLPPYIASRRPVDHRDAEDYQSIFARRPGSVAAPTASLHFDPALMDSLCRHGVSVTWITLHVGAGTFLPAPENATETETLHPEQGEVSPDAAEEIGRTRRNGGRIIPVGTTALRVLETAARTQPNAQGPVGPWRGETDIFIKPGFRFHVADALITNFHLPGSTLLMLVSAFMGLARTRRIYAHAMARDYRFYSYGDGSFLEPKVKKRP